MKIKLLLLFASSPAFACGLPTPNTFTDPQSLLATVTSGAERLFCQGKDGEQETSLHVHAIYRCIGSPLAAELKTQGAAGTIPVKSVSGTREALVFQGLREEVVHCRVASLSGEQARQKKEIEDQRRARAEAEKARNAADIARITDTQSKMMDAAIRSRLLADFELVDFRFTYASLDKEGHGFVDFRGTLRQISTQESFAFRGNGFLSWDGTAKLHSLEN